MKKYNHAYFVQKLYLLIHYRLFIPLLVAYCFICIVCHRDISLLNNYDVSSIIDVLSYQFNTYSYILLFSLPVFAVIQNHLFISSKYNELILTRYKNRKSYFVATEAFFLKFVILYRLAEIVATSGIFVVSHLLSDTPFRAFDMISLPIQNQFGITIGSKRESLLLCLYVQVALALLYFLYSQIVFLINLLVRNGLAAEGLLFLSCILMLVEIKIDYWFDSSPIRNLLPHRNLFLQCMFSKLKNDYSLTRLIWPLLYWSLLFLSVGAIIFYICEHIDFLYNSAEAGQDAGG